MKPMKKVEVKIQGGSRVMVPDRTVSLPSGPSRHLRGEVPHQYTVETTTDGRRVVFRNGMSWGFLSGGGGQFARNAAPGDFVPNELNPIDFRYNDPPDENGESIRYGRWEAGTQGSGIDEEPRQWYEVKYAVGSNYSGGSVYESNYKELEKMLEETHPSGSTPAVWATAYGGHGTYGIIVVYAELDESIQETLSALDEYPLISEEAHSELEMEQQEEAWSSWARSDFESAFLKEWNALWKEDEEVDDWPDEFNSQVLFEIAREVANEYWQDQNGEGQWIDMKRIVPKAVDILSGEQELPTWIDADRVEQLVELGLALGMEKTPAMIQRERERGGQQRLPGIKNN